MNIRIVLTSAILGIAIQGCSGPQKRLQKDVVDSTDMSKAAPTWVTSTTQAWQEEDNVIFRGTTSVRGTDRLNACYDLARLESKKSLLAELKENIKSDLDVSTQSMSEDLDAVFAQTTSTSMTGNITGMRIEEQYFERYVVNGTERLDCHIKAKLSRTDYEQLRRRVLSGMSNANAAIAQAVQEKHLGLINGTAKREPASEGAQ